MHFLKPSYLTFFTLEPSPAPSKWLIPQNLYIFRKYIPWLYSLFFLFFKNLYNKKVFFVPRVVSQIVKILSFDPYLVPPTLGAGSGFPIFVLRAQGSIHPYGLKSGFEILLQLSDHSLYFVLVTQGMRLV